MGTLRAKRVSGSDQELVRNTMLRNRTIHTPTIPGFRVNRFTETFSNVTGPYRWNDRVTLDAWHPNLAGRWS